MYFKKLLYNVKVIFLAALMKPVKCRYNTFRSHLYSLYVSEYWSSPRHAARVLTLHHLHYYNLFLWVDLVCWIAFRVLSQLLAVWESKNHRVEIQLHGLQVSSLCFWQLILCFSSKTTPEGGRVVTEYLIKQSSTEENFTLRWCFCFRHINLCQCPRCQKQEVHYSFMWYYQPTNQHSLFKTAKLIQQDVSEQYGLLMLVLTSLVGNIPFYKAYKSTNWTWLKWTTSSFTAFVKGALRNIFMACKQTKKQSFWYKK